MDQQIAVLPLVRGGMNVGYRLFKICCSGGVGNLQHLIEGVTQGHTSIVLAASIFQLSEGSIADAHAALGAVGFAARKILAKTVEQVIDKYQGVL